MVPIANTCSIGYPHDGRADNTAYRHDHHADKRRYGHDRHADSLSRRLSHSADEYNLHGAKRLFTIQNVLSASRPSVNQDGENKPFLHIDCFI